MVDGAVARAANDAEIAGNDVVAKVADKLIMLKWQLGLLLKYPIVLLL